MWICTTNKGELAKERESNDPSRTFGRSEMPEKLLEVKRQEKKKANMN
jgi:hypothetical protein